MRARFDCVHLHVHPIHRGHNPNNLTRACGVVTVNEIHVRGGWNFYHMYAYVTPLGLMQIDGRMMLDRHCAPVAIALLLRSIQPRWVLVVCLVTECNSIGNILGGWWGCSVSGGTSVLSDDENGGNGRSGTGIILRAFVPACLKTLSLAGLCPKQVCTTAPKGS